ncbi:MAG: hypothetical protein EBZ61_10520, partial [Micrococcales bacterium]|nr:hypothetical protein [Micrococcales bacterium]
LARPLGEHRPQDGVALHHAELGRGVYLVVGTGVLARGVVTHGAAALRTGLRASASRAFRGFPGT